MPHLLGVTQTTAIRTLEKLLPQINAGQEPTDVLIKYAHDKNLSAAQLEKLGHVLNTVKTLTVMTKSASRGDNPNIVDVEKMVRLFRADKPSIKRASETPELVFEKVANIRPAIHEGPDWVKDRHQDTAPVLPRHSRAVLDRFHDTREQEAAFTIAMGQQDYAVKTAAAKFFELSGDRLGEALQDIQALDPEAHAVLVPTIKAAGVQWTEPPDDRKIVWDRLGCLDAAQTLTREIQTHQNLAGMHEEFVKQGAISVDVGKAPTAEELLSGPPEPPKPAPRGEPRGEPSRAPAGREPEPEVIRFQRGIPSDQLSPEEQLNQMSRDDVELLKMRLLARQYLDQAAKGETPASGSALAAGASTLEGLGSALEQSLKYETQTPGVARDLASAYVDLLSDKQRLGRQDSLDKVRRESRSAANIQRLILTDPILREADPADVVQAYNSLRAQNPELMSDINVSRALLREAIQYPHIPLSTLQGLTDVRNKALQGRVFERQTKTPNPTTK